MTLFSSWFRPSFRTEHKPQAAPISTTPLSIFKGFKLGRRESERDNPQPFEKAKKSIPNRRNRPEIKVLPLVSQIPIGTPRDPPPPPPKALRTSLSIPGPKFNPQQHAGQHPQMRSETETNISRRIFSSTLASRNVGPRIVENNRAHAPPEATSPLAVHSLSSPNPTALEFDDWPNPPQPRSIHPPIGPRSLPVTSPSIYEGVISTSGAGEQEGDVPLPPPQDDGTPRLESGPSVGSFMGLRSRWSSTANDSTEDEEPPSFCQRFKFHYRIKASRDGQTHGKVKRSGGNKATTFRDWTLPSFLRSTGSSRNPSLSPPTGLGPSQSASVLNRYIYQNDGETSPMDSNSSPIISAVIVKTAGPVRTRGAPVDPNEDNSPQYSVVLSHANGLFSAHPIPFK